MAAGTEIADLWTGPLGPKIKPEPIDKTWDHDRDPIRRRATFGVPYPLFEVAIEKSGDKLSVHASAGNERKVFEAELVVHGAGRVPEISDLNLAAAGVQAEERGIRVNQYLQSISNPAVYAAEIRRQADYLRLRP